MARLCRSLKGVNHTSCCIQDLYLCQYFDLYGCWATNIISHDVFMCTPLILSLTVQDGFSPLYAASHEGHTEIVDLLVRAGADVNQATTKVHNYICDTILDTNNCIQYWHVIIASLNEVYMPVMNIIYRQWVSVLGGFITPALPI